MQSCTRPRERSGQADAPDMLLLPRERRWSLPTQAASKIAGMPDAGKSEGPICRPLQQKGTARQRTALHTRRGCSFGRRRPAMPNTASTLPSAETRRRDEGPREGPPCLTPTAASDPLRPLPDKACGCCSAPHCKGPIALLRGRLARRLAVRMQHACQFTPTPGTETRLLRPQGPQNMANRVGFKKIAWHKCCMLTAHARALAYQLLACDGL